MTTITLSASTQAAIDVAINQGPGTNNANYLAAYNDIYNDIKNVSGINPGTLNWFSQAGFVNTQAFNPNAPGTFIWNYTESAAALEGVTITNNDMQKASDAIATTVFQTLKSSNFVFNDTANFSPSTIIQDDAGSGIDTLKALHPDTALDYAIWGGTLFATTELNDPNYFSTYHIDLAPGSVDCTAIETGLTAGIVAVAGSSSISTYVDSLVGSLNLDLGAIAACLIDPSQFEDPTQFSNSLSGQDSSTFAAKDHDLETALAQLVSNPSNTTTLSTDWTKVADDFEGYSLVSSGQTWSSLAGANNVTVADLQAANSNLGTGALVAGTVIILPTSVTSTSSPSLSGLTGAGYYDASTGDWITTPASLDGSNAGQITILPSDGGTPITLDTAAISLTASSGTVTAGIDSAGDTLIVNPNDTTAIKNAAGTTLASYSAGQLAAVDPSATGSATIDTILASSSVGDLLGGYTLNSLTGGITSTGAIFDGADYTGGSWTQYQSAVSAISGELTSTEPSYTATSAAVNTDIFGSVSPLGSGYGAGGITLADGTDQNYVPGDLVDTGAGLYVEMPIANSPGLFNSAPTNVATDNLQISQGRYMVASQNDPYIIDQQSPYIGGIAFAQTASGLANGANLTADTDPLLIDLTGNGIQVSNWIDNDVYFQSNVTTSGSTESEDTSLHHSSWMQSGTGMLVFDPGDTAITNITQTRAI